MLTLIEMTHKTVRTHILKLILSSLGIMSLAFVTPENGDLIELGKWLNARSSAEFRSFDRNKITALQPGTRAVVKQVQHFEGSGNYGLCIELLNTPMRDGSDCYWIYYRASRPSISIYRMQGADREALLRRWGTQPRSTPIRTDKLIPTQRPTPQAAVQVERPTPALPQIKRRLPPSFASNTTDVILFQTLNWMNHFNNNQTEIVRPQVADPCEDGSCLMPTLTYEQCNSNNDYYNTEILNLRSRRGFIQDLFAEALPNQIKPQCVQNSLATTTRSARFYQYCSSPEGEPNQAVPRPCASENYVQLVSRSFNLVSGCFKDYLGENAEQKIEDIFALMTLESGLNVNARSPIIRENGRIVSGGAGGPGQLTQPAISDVNRTEHQKMIEYLENHSQQHCSGLLKETLSAPMSAQFSKSCERISLSAGNPIKNMAYVFAGQKKLQNYIGRTLLQDEDYNEILSELSEEQKNNLISKLSIWAHNTGLGGILEPLEAYLTREYISQQKSLKTDSDIENFLSGLKSYVSRFPHLANSSQARRRETSVFFESVERRYNNIKQAVGGGSCLNI